MCDHSVTLAAQKVVKAFPGQSQTGQKAKDLEQMSLILVGKNEEAMEGQIDSQYRVCEYLDGYGHISRS